MPGSAEDSLDSLRYWSAHWLTVNVGGGFNASRQRASIRRKFVEYVDDFLSDDADDLTGFVSVDKLGSKFSR
jgi:hypothetical protein